MGFFTLLEVATMPVLQVLLISILGAFMSTEYWNLLNADARSYLNKIVFNIFTPSLIFASLANTVTLQDVITWWFMPVNMGLSFLVGGILGWIVVKILKPEPYLEGLIIATCSAGNVGNLLVIIVPSICNEDGSPFGDPNICSSVVLSYVSFSMALGGFYIWTYTFHLVQNSASTYKATQVAEESLSRKPNNDFDTNSESHLLKADDQDQTSIQVISTKAIAEDMEKELVFAQSSGKAGDEIPFWGKLTGFLHQIVEELMSPPTVGGIMGFIFGCVPFLRNLIIGKTAPLRVIQDSIKLLGDGTIPSIILILGGNLIKGLRSAKLNPLIIIGVILVRYLILPLIGIGLVKVAGDLGFLSPDPLYRYVLMLQFSLPPATSIGTMTQLFDVGKEECSVLFLWTYLVAAFALTIWSTVYMWVLS
ncbi:protein PIN-LIKES 7-like [Macadamia integrifolia]|uniref:protein PIN-LIKES 7-like n=1 Tax=Macadamia integrifolia TaxID=60698 RepID=UPI001C4E79EA|nr:protein PIN-LIKES 7-like [Macadamia integrifolia]XP_042507934.1 protein PIN-LIKES 7-like [Macadamia integrifolia]XP_042507935.1 protein PIN-LIKES 7-like [Macadamia integrifolia]XP_042507936.1 protein PIN-LIKES 7-like [Macadamia integrifolia]